jgi:AcrR family transcriptional regulator
VPSALFDRADDAVVVDRLFSDEARAGVAQGFVTPAGAPGGRDDDAGSRRSSARRAHDGMTVRAWHLEIGDDRIEVGATQRIDGLFSGAQRDHVVTVAGQQPAERVSGSGVVVDDEESSHIAPETITPSAAGSVRIGQFVRTRPHAGWRAHHSHVDAKHLHLRLAPAVKLANRLGSLPALRVVMKRRLDRARAVDAALAVIDDVGVDGLSLRAVAARANVPTMTLYGHIASRGELLDLAFERVVERLVEPQHAKTWQAELDALARHARGVLVEHPNWGALLTREAVPIAAIVEGNHLMTLMTDAGLTQERAIYAISSAMMFALGDFLVERMMRAAPVRQLHIVRAVAATSRPAFPLVTKVAPRLARWSFDAVFDRGLKSLIAGVDTPRTRRASQPRRR